MKITMEPIASIRPYPSNPRKNKTAIIKLARILSEVGFRQPIVVDSDRVIIAGHTRLEAAKRLGMKEVPVHIATDMSPEQVKAWRIADNRVGQEAEWDTELLKIEIGELVDMDFDTDFLGFDEDRVDDHSGRRGLHDRAGRAERGRVRPRHSLQHPIR
jgi:ParB-like chromosome segregation protein Spo0J